VFVLGASVALGGAVMRVDFHEIRDELDKLESNTSVPSHTAEMAAEFQHASKSDVMTSPDAIVAPLIDDGLVAHACWLGRCIFLAVAVMFVTIASIRLMEWCPSCSELAGSAEHASAMELQSLVQDASSSTKAIVADSLVMLGLGASVAIGAAVMRVDNHDMGQELQSGSEVTVSHAVTAQIMKTAAHAHPFWRQRFFGLPCVTVVLAATASAGFMAWPTSLNEEVEHAGAKELRALVEFNSSSALLPDYLVVFVLGAFVTLGAAVMRLDFHEISYELESEMRAPSQSKVTIPSTGESVADAVILSIQTTPPSPCRHLQYGLPSGRCVLKYVGIAAVCVVLSSFVGALPSANQEELAGSAEHASTMELQSLVQDASCSTKTIVADSLVMLGLSALVAIGAAVMRVDNHEMGQELRSGSEVTVQSAATAPPMKTAAHPHPSWRQCLFGLLWVTVVLVATASAWFMVWSTSLSEEVEHAGAMELRALVEFNSSSALLPDYLVMFVLGALVALGAAVIRVDFHEISDELESEMRAPAQEKVK